MAKIGRNQPCTCGSGRKYKRCCWHRDRAAHVHTAPTTSPHGYHFAETDLDRLSNSVVRLVDEGRLDEADAACEQLRTRYPDVHDWLMRKAMVCEARGETERAIEYLKRCCFARSLTADFPDCLTRSVPGFPTLFGLFRRDGRALTVCDGGAMALSDCG